MDTMCSVCLFIYHPSHPAANHQNHLDCQEMRGLWNDAMESKPHITAYKRMTQVHPSWFFA